MGFQNMPIQAKKSFSRMGFALLAIAGVTIILQIALMALLKPEGWLMWLSTFAPLYLAGVPVGLLIINKLPVSPRESIDLGAKNFFLLMLMCFPMMYVGNIVGTLLSLLLSGGSSQNALETFAFDSNSLLKILFLVVLAPVIEEFLFRKQIIDRCVQYGEKTAILFSALTFGLFHMNLYQFFYAFGLGLVFGYVYVRTRRVRYSIIMHMIVNFMGSVIAPALISFVGEDAFNQLSSGQMEMDALMGLLPKLAGFALYLFALFALSVAGLIVLITYAPRLVFARTVEEIPKVYRFNTVYGNPGVILFTLLCIIVCILTLIQGIVN
ncbi:MAG TPA: type II CAAX endopeptidase family protein [Bacillota bacterium]|nr:type II CAAX endopeptidase family protein [Bacillota bacterium]